MRLIQRIEIVKMLSNWNTRHYQLFTMLAIKNKYSRHAFNRMYRTKLFEEWTELDKQNTLGYMLGYNVIQG